MAYVEPNTAQDVVGIVGGSTVIEDENKAKADAANVSDVQYINYAAALTNYQARADVESLANRRAREAATTFAATDFARGETYTGNE